MAASETSPYSFVLSDHLVYIKGRPVSLKKKIKRFLSTQVYEVVRRAISTIPKLKDWDDAGTGEEDERVRFSLLGIFLAAIVATQLVIILSATTS